MDKTAYKIRIVPPSQNGKDEGSAIANLTVRLGYTEIAVICKTEKTNG
jgi:hypothetical protein